jgi:hypothetical protein
MRRWKESFPAIFVRCLQTSKGVVLLLFTRIRFDSLKFTVRTYLFAHIRPASSASLLICTRSFERRWTHMGNSSADARLRPVSKMRILDGGTA